MRNLPELLRPFFDELDFPYERIRGHVSQLGSDFKPTFHVEEAETHYLLRFDIPGVKKDDIKIELQGERLSVSGKRSSEYETKENKTYSEQWDASFERTFTLPRGDLKPEQLEASYQDGVLRLVIPKSELSKAHSIQIGEGKPRIWDQLLGNTKSVA